MFLFWLHLVFVYLAVVLPFAAARRVRAMNAQAIANPRAVQLSLYPRLIAAQWLLALAIVLVLWKVGVPPAQLGIVKPSLVPLAWTAAVLAIAWAIWERRLRRAVNEPARRARLLERYARVRFLLPAEDSMIGWWVAVSITAGVCEETLYRGFIGYYLQHWMPLAVAALVGTIPFAVAHAYQGWRGVLRTGLAGLLLWATYLATGSILPGMVLHAAIDVRSGLAVKDAVLRDAAERAAVAPAPTSAGAG
jgi:membrane protease YdiL (CAAX protease family)